MVTYAVVELLLLFFMTWNWIQFIAGALLYTRTSFTDT
jgi:hypothetical protein